MNMADFLDLCDGMDIDPRVILDEWIKDIEMYKKMIDR